MKAKKPKGKRTAQEVTRWAPPRGYFAVVAFLIVLAAGTMLVAALYRDRALPGVYVGSVAVNGLAAPEVKQIVEAQKDQLKVVFQDGDTSLTATAAELGMLVDVDTTVENTLAARRVGGIADNLSVWQNQSVPLAYTNDPGVLKEYVARHFPSTYVDPQDAQLEYNAVTKQFDVKKAVLGKGFDIKRFETALPDLARNPRMLVLPVSTIPVEPLIGNEAAEKTQEDINEQIAIKIEFKRDGQVAYTVDAGEIAKWVHFNPDATAGTLTPDFDVAKIEQFLRDQVGGKVTTLPQDRKVIKDKATGQETVVQAGRKGYQVKDTDKLAQDVINALKNRETLSRELDVTEAPFKTVTITGTGKWIEIDLSQQRLTAWIGDEVAGTWLISSGTAKTPTQIGEGRIYAKRTSQTMTGTIAGEYYYVPNVKWVSYFNGGEAIHGTYWHNNFGHPMSHGCINMTEAAAKFIYDFAPIGTKVIVHQ
jgi:lipoprotein-anchoring transpeptidase ErfK/SrfK